MAKQLCGIYIHYPYCDVKCSYCDFYSLASRNSKKLNLIEFERKYLLALTNEIKEKKKYFKKDYQVASVFFGGGTPSKASASFIAAVLDILKEEFLFSRIVTPEITIEANPESITKEKLNHWKKAGINRISVGIQSRSKKLLHYLGRLYSVKAYTEVFAKIQRAGFKNYSADFIYGIPGQTWMQLKDDVDWAISAGVSHVSAYSLTLEDDTALKVLTEKRLKDKKPLSTRRQVFHQQNIKTHLESKGFQQYEVSNFSKPGLSSLHNKLCWQHRPYLGLGVAAHSYLSGKRIASPKSLSKYMRQFASRSIDSNTILVEQESVIEDTLLGIFRLVQWQSINSVSKSFTSRQKEIFRREICQMAKENLLDINEPFFKIKQSTLLFADTYILRLAMAVSENE